MRRKWECILFSFLLCASSGASADGTLTKARVRIKFDQAQETQSLLQTLVPDVTCTWNNSDLILEGSPGAVFAVQELLRELDRKPDDVVVDVKLASVTEQCGRELREILPESVAIGRSRVKVLTSTPVTESAPFSLGCLTKSGSICDDRGHPILVSSPLNRWVISGGMRILASPRIATRSGREGGIFLGDQIPLISFDPRRRMFHTRDVSVGLKLFAKPQIRVDGHVALDLRAEESTLVSLIDQQHPRTRVRTNRLHLLIRDGDTIAVTGLVTKPDLETVGKIPLLGDLVLSSILRGTSAKDELFLLLTPHIMR